MLRLNQTISTTAIAAAKPTLTADTVTPGQIQTVSFLKYVHLSLLDKEHFLQFYELLLTQATGYTVFLRPSDDITSTNTVVPDGMDPKSTQVSATTLHSKLSMKGTIADTYTDAHNLLATTTDGYEVLQFLMNQCHPSLAVKNIATVDIPKYSTYNSLFRYAREIKQYVKNHKIQMRVFIEREITHIFLSHLDHPRYATAVKQREADILLSPNIDKIYLVPAIAGTIDQLAPGTTSTTHQQWDQHRERSDARVRALLDYYHDDESPPFDDFCQPIDNVGESPFCRSFRDGGGRTPFSRGGGRGRLGRTNNRYGRGGRGRQPTSSFKRKCNSCGMANHHADSCHFLMKLRQALTYLGVDPESGFKKKQHFQGRQTYNKHRSTVRSLIDAGFIPFSGADADTFLDVVDDEPDVFSPDIINSVDDEDDVYEEE